MRICAFHRAYTYFNLDKIPKTRFTEIRTSLIIKHKKNLANRCLRGLLSGPTWARTKDPLIMSQML
nr:hypothetical protein [uncultured bacterium]